MPSCKSQPIMPFNLVNIKYDEMKTVNKQVHADINVVDLIWSSVMSATLG